MGIVYNELSSTRSDEFLMVSITFFVVVDSLCFYCSGQHCVLVFCPEISLRKCGITHKEYVLEYISFFNVMH